METYIIDTNKIIITGGRVDKRSEVTGQKVGGRWTEGQGSFLAVEGLYV